VHAIIAAVLAPTAQTITYEGPSGLGNTPDVIHQALTAFLQAFQDHPAVHPLYVAWQTMLAVTKPSQPKLN